MDGRDSSGRMVSLLNEQASIMSALPARAPYFQRRTSIRPRPLQHRSSLHGLSRHATLPPPLSRSDSSDSRVFSSPSPITPSFLSYDTQEMPQPGKGALSTVKRHISRQSSSSSTTSAYAFRADEASVSGSTPTTPLSATLPTSAPLLRTQNSDASDITEQQRSRKNQYPCPMASLYDCVHFFTTSGHAARHAKKHTGRKDAFCPECNKAFTRKDNMEQHRRTHQTGRAVSAVSKDHRIQKVAKSPVRQRSIEPRESEQNPPAEMTDVDGEVDGALRSPRAHPLNTEQEPSSPLAINLPSRPPLLRTSHAEPSGFAMAAAQRRPELGDPQNAYGLSSPGLSNGLDALALVASDHRRLSEGSS